MTHQEAEKMLAELKQGGMSEEEILGALYKMFQNDEITIEGLEGLVETLGWHFTEEFRNMSPEDQKTKGYEEVDDEEEVSEEVVEAAKEHPTKENEVAESNPQASESKPEGKEEADESEDAMKLFGLNKK